MQLTFVQLSRFAARWAQMKLMDEDLQALERMLLRNPTADAVYLLTSFSKNEKANLTAAEKAEARKLIEFIGRSLARG